MNIDLCFSGWLIGANITQVLDVATGQMVSVNKLDITSQELVEKLANGDLVISFADALENCRKYEIELLDYSASDLVNPVHCGRGMIVIINSQGAICAETGLCSAHDTPTNRKWAESQAQDPPHAGDPAISNSWTDCSNNDVKCILCDKPL